MPVPAGPPRCSGAPSRCSGRAEPASNPRVAGDTADVRLAPQQMRGGPVVALTSPYPDVEIPDVSVPEFVLARGRDRPAPPALIDGLKGDVITHGQLAAYVDRVAANLHARGLRKGDVVAVFCPNTPWFPVVFHGIAAAGCVMSPINSLYTPDEIAFQLEDSGAKILITVSPFLDRALGAVGNQPVDDVVVMD